MKIYAIEYDIMIGVEIEHRVETYTDIGEFINRVKYLNDKYYITDIYVYSGELARIDINKILNPF